MPVRAGYLDPVGIGVHNPPTTNAITLDAFQVVVLVILSLAPLVVAHHVLPAPIAHASNHNHLNAERLDIGEDGRGRSRCSGASCDEPSGL